MYSELPTQQLNLYSGPNWIHGSDHNPILDLAHETNSIVVSPMHEVPLVFDDTGHQLSEQTGKEISRLVWGIIDDAFKHSNEESASIPPDRSLMDFFRIRAKEKKLDEVTSNLVFQMAQIWGDYVGEPIDTQSLKYMWMEECIDDGSLFSPPFPSIVPLSSACQKIFLSQAHTVQFWLASPVRRSPKPIFTSPQKPRLSCTTSPILKTPKLPLRPPPP